ncbi:hypothetical protein PCASD_13077 [Puccinia coronata f. sp. avenae]|uniref:No apical meristem-associated C-terminal domain-containing protein n=1 Tax=Puccinia coronata f. sp. avenae TaxID=200324 RepID=A0A2N5U8L8_9BASI|nr:hypothetical protein PCASD_19537 [Puccinia coronata f. sp. avenae]PLW34090.1 hypothetical protein PCASD_13077 [Puccinia coronata f. sp. avenae]
MEDTNTPATPNTVPTTEETPQKKKRSPNWLPNKEEHLATSWLHISKKPEFANNQSGKVFYRKIELDFNSHSKTHYRDFNQIKTRWVSLNTTTLKFLAIYNNIEHNPPSGTSPEDWLVLESVRSSQQKKKLPKRQYAEEQSSPSKGKDHKTTHPTETSKNSSRSLTSRISSASDNQSKHNKPNIVPSSLLNRISLVASKLRIRYKYLSPSSLIERRTHSATSFLALRFTVLVPHQIRPNLFNQREICKMSRTTGNSTRGRQAETAAGTSNPIEVETSSVISVRKDDKDIIIIPKFNGSN